MAADLESAIAAGQIAPVYVLAGDHPILYQRILAQLVAKVVEPATRAFNYDSFEAKAAGAAAILSAVRTVPMMAKRRLVVVRDLDLLPADEQAAIAPYLDNPSPLTVLVLHATKIDGRMKLFAAARKKGFLHEIEAPRQLAPWIRTEAERAGARIGEDGTRRLLEIVGKDFSRLATVVEQLALYVGPGDGNVITAADVDELVAETRERTVFELANAIGQGERERALRACARLFDQRESAVGVTMMLARHMRQVGLVRELLAARTPRSELPRLIGIPPFAVDDLAGQARRFTAPAVAAGLALLAKTDVDLKGPVKAALGERIVVERLVEGLLRLGTGSGAGGRATASR